jgi:hypothetical protein
MSFTNRHIIETYTELLDGLSETNKIELIESLSKSLKKESKKKDSAFFNSFGAFGSERKAELIIKEIRASRKFRKKEISF